MVDLPCPTCGSPLTFLEQYQRNYCLRCGQYAPEGYGDRGARRCPTCGGILSFIAQYNRFYCYHCNTYAPDEPTPSAKSTTTPSAAAPAPSPSAPPAASPVAPASESTAADGQTTLVAVAAPSPAPPVAPTTQEPAPTPAAQPESKPETVDAPAAPATPAPEPAAEPVAAEPSKEIQALAASKPAIVRVKIFALKKSELIDLAKAYNLDPSGTKEQVQERLLSYLHDLEAEEEPERETPSAPEAATPAIGPSPASVSIPEAASESVHESIVAAPASAGLVVEMEKPEPEPAPREPAPEAAPSGVEVSRIGAKAEHPCPTCGRELTFIAQYDRYYCYSCQRYAPAVRVKGACPTCGATMRWIDQHQRWWCDACQKYAPADLPKPASAAAVAARPVSPSAVERAARPAIVIHHHASPATGIGLVGVGLALWVIYEFFAVLAPAMSLAISNPFTDSLGDVMVFFAFLFVAAGVMLGLSSLRDRF